MVSVAVGHGCVGVGGVGGAGLGGGRVEDLEGLEEGS